VKNTAEAQTLPLPPSEIEENTITRPYQERKSQRRSVRLNDSSFYCTAIIHQTEPFQALRPVGHSVPAKTETTHYCKPTKMFLRAATPNTHPKSISYHNLLFNTIRDTVRIGERPRHLISTRTVPAPEHHPDSQLTTRVLSENECGVEKKCRHSTARLNSTNPRLYSSYMNLL